MDQAELDAAYTQSVWAPNREQLVARHRRNSAIARTYLGAPPRYAYGAPPIEALDVYRTTRSSAPSHSFIHGGAWRGDPQRLYVSGHSSGGHLAGVLLTTD